MPLSVAITAPQKGVHLQVGQQYRIAGTIQGRPAADPPVLAAFTVSAPGLAGPVATQARGHGVWTFAAQGVAAQAGVFTLTAEATDEDGRQSSGSVTVLVGLVYSPTAPAILFDVVPALFEVSFPFLGPKLQAVLTPLTALLASGGGVLVGPNQSQNRGLPKAGAPLTISVGTERIALWILDPNATPSPPRFGVAPADPPHSLLPVLPEPAVAATFGSALVPAPTVPAPMGTLGTFGFGLTISLAALQLVASALLPRLQAEAAKHGVSIDAISIQCSLPNIVQTVISGHANVLGVTLTITELLSVVASPRSATGQMVPGVTGTATISAPGLVWLELLAGIVDILGGVILATFATSLLNKGEASVNNALSLANASFSGLPEVIAFPAVGGVGGLFPGVIPNWTALTASASGITAAGTFVLRSRTAADAFVAISGPTEQSGPAFEFVGGAAAAYVVSWTGILPDATTFTATISGPGPGGVEVIPLPADGAQTTSIVLTFAFASDPPRPGRHKFLITVSATETSAADPSQTLSATARFSLTVLVFRQLVIP